MKLLKMISSDEFGQCQNFQWIMANLTLFDINVESNTWESWENKPFYDISVQSNNSRILTTGRGSDRNSIIATLKSFCEYVERYTCVESKIPSSGTAAHFLEDNARLNAINELIERHLVLYHLKNNLPFMEISYHPVYLMRYSNDVLCTCFSTISCNGVTAFVIRGKLRKRNGYVYITGTRLDEELEIQFLRKLVSLLEHGFEAGNAIQDNCLNNSIYSFNEYFSNKNTNNKELFLSVATERVRCERFERICVFKAFSKDALLLTDFDFHFIG